MITDINAAPVLRASIERAILTGIEAGRTTRQAANDHINRLVARAAVGVLPDGLPTGIPAESVATYLIDYVATVHSEMCTEWARDALDGDGPARGSTATHTPAAADGPFIPAAYTLPAGWPEVDAPPPAPQPMPGWVTDTGLPDPRPQPRRFPRAAAAAAAALLAVMAAAVVWHFAAAAARPDSGVAVCKAVATNLTGTTGAYPGGYPKLRADLAASRFDDVRVSGTAMFDLVAALDGGDEETQAGLLLLSAGQFTQDYAAFAGACSAHGVTLPPIGN